MSEEIIEYIVPNRAEPLTIVASDPINENWDKIQQAINENYDLASQVNDKIDISERGVEGGIATLDINNKLEVDQVPDIAKGHVYEVNSLAEQLSLNAYVGDICVRKDVNKSYALKCESASSVSSWVEIGAINSFGEIGSNPCYTESFSPDEWDKDEAKNIYYIHIDDAQHGQGNNQYLLVNITNHIGQNILCDYVISQEGLVTIYSEVNFDARVMISNLSGNCKNSFYIPYSIISGYSLDQKPAFISFSFSSISLITNSPLVVVDGFNIVRNIMQANDLNLDTSILEDSNNILFIDSSNVNNNILSNLSYLPSTKYHGIVDKLPENAQPGDRCYVRFNKSYEYVNDSWQAKAFVPIGEFVIEQQHISSVICYQFMQNGININYASHELDFLLGDIIQGLDISFNDTLKIETGKCLVGNRILTLPNSMVKDYNSEWQAGSGNGCLDATSKEFDLVYEVTKGGVNYFTDQAGEINSYVEPDVGIYNDKSLDDFNKLSESEEFLYTGITYEYETEKFGWGNVFIISNNDPNVFEIMLGYQEKPILPIGYNSYRRIGYFYRNEDLVFEKQKQINDKNYLYVPKIINTQINDQITNIPVDLPDGVDIIFSYNLNEPQNLVFYYEDFEIHEEYGKNNTLQLPCYNNTLQIKGQKVSDITIKVLGYLDRREL